MKNKPNKLKKFSLLIAISVLIFFGAHKIINAQGSEYILLSSYNLMPNQTFTVSGFGYEPNKNVTVKAADSKQDLTTDNTGNVVSSPFTVPFVGGGQLQINANSATAGLSVATFYPFVQPNDYYIIPGNNVTFAGIRFAPNENVRITRNGSDLGNVQANGNGEFSSQTFNVGYNSSQQSYTFTGTQSGSSFTVNLTVASLKPWILLSSYYEKAGSGITITGMGFGANENVDVWYDDSSLGSAMTSSTGQFNLSSTIPNSSNFGPGQHLIKAQSTQTGASAQETFTQAQN